MRGGKFAPFFEKPCFRVENYCPETREQPSIACSIGTDEQIVYALAGNRWFNSDPAKILETPSDIIMKSYHYMVFVNQYKEMDFRLMQQASGLNK